MKLHSTWSFCKLVKLLAGGGTKIFRLLLEKLSAPFSFEDYMCRHQADIFNLKLTEDQKDLIIRREVEKMDITLLSKLLFKLFKDKLTPRQIELVNGLKNQRDLFVHSHILENAEMDLWKFHEKYDKIETLLLNLANEMGSREVQNQMKDFTVNLTNDKIDFEEIRGTLMEWFSSSDDKERDIGTLQKSLDELELVLETWRLRNLPDDYLEFDVLPGFIGYHHEFNAFRERLRLQELEVVRGTLHFYGVTRNHAGDSLDTSIASLTIMSAVTGKDLWTYVQGNPHLFSVGGLFYNQVQRDLGLTDGKHCQLPCLPGKVFRYSAKEDRLEICLEPYGHFPIEPNIEQKVKDTSATAGEEGSEVKFGASGVIRHGAEHKAFQAIDDFSVMFKQEYLRMKERKAILRNGSSRDAALNHLDNSNLTLLQGDQGIGKTTLAFETADWFIERKQIDLKRCAMIINPSDVKGVHPRDVDLLLVDGIGNKQNMVPLWEESLKYLENILHGYNVKVIITTRTPINLEMKTQKGNFKLASKTVKLQCPAPFPGD